MTLTEFATATKTRIKRDTCLDPIIPGKWGHIYEHSPSQLGIFIGDTPNANARPNTTRSRLRRVEALGFVGKQKADAEGTFLIPLTYELSNAVFARLLRIMGIRKIRKATGRPFQKRVGG